MLVRLSSCALFFFATLLLTEKTLAQEFESIPGEYLVKIKKNQAKLSRKAIEEALQGQIKSEIKEQNIFVIKRASVERTESALKNLKTNSFVEYADPNYIYRAVRTPNDSDFGKLWGLKNTGQTDGSQVGVAGVDIDAEKAWDITQGSESTVIAVIDTGVDYTHPDLAQNIWTNELEANGQAGIDDDGNGYVDDIHGYDFSSTQGDADPIDDHGHGSHCSGTISGRGNDGRGIVGVNWNTKIMAIKFLDAGGSGSLEGAVRSINYATKMKVKVTSNSWGGGGYSDALKEAIENANKAGSLFIAAAGNNGSNNDSIEFYPANYAVANVLSVAAVDNKGKVADFSNFGKRKVHLAAPGVNVFSSTHGGGYASWSGTSMATPHVSGVAGLLMSQEPNLTALEIKERLIKTARPMPTLKQKVASGGMVNAFYALTNFQAPPDPNDPALWAQKTLSISTPHPYASKTRLTYDVKIAGATEFALYFEKFESETRYDKVTIYDGNGIKVEEISGSYDQSYSAVIKGDTAKLVFTSDDSVEKYGFDLTKAAYR